MVNKRKRGAKRATVLAWLVRNIAGRDVSRHLRPLDQCQHRACGEAMWSSVEHAAKAGDLPMEDGVARVNGITTAMRNKARPITAKASLKRRVL